MQQVRGLTLKTAPYWNIPTSQRERVQMVLLRESGMTQPAIAAAMVNRLDVLASLQVERSQQIIGGHDPPCT
jgi:hypothetical protein